MLSGLVFVLVLLLPMGAAFKAWVTGGETGTAIRAGVEMSQTRPMTQPTTHPSVEAAAEHALAQHAWALHVFDAVRGLLAIVVVLLILALLYHFGPGVKHRWQYLSPGSVFVFATWVLVALVFRYYVNHFGRSKYEETYGPVGGVAVLLLLFYLDALVLLIGAQINSEIDFDVLKVPRGSRNFLAASSETQAGADSDDERAFADPAYSHGAD
jgi:uncharacterized BrkB/YihY/UPF0761 family membrane protein